MILSHIIYHYQYVSSFCKSYIWQVEQNQEEEKEEENEQHKGYILCLGYLATID